jgi:hypothetical protein
MPKSTGIKNLAGAGHLRCIYFSRQITIPWPLAKKVEYRLQRVTSSLVAGTLISFQRFSTSALGNHAPVRQIHQHQMKRANEIDCKK